MPLLLPATAVSVPRFRSDRRLFSLLIEAAGQLFIAFWEGSWEHPPLDVASFKHIEALLQSATLRDELNSSLFHTFGQHAQIRMRKETDTSYPVVKIATPNETLCRQQIASEHGFLLHLQNLNFPSVIVESNPLQDQDGIFGFRMALLYPVSQAELHKRITELEQMVGRLHDLCVVHGDLSVSNVMKTADGDLCLIDFGAAGQLDTELPEWHVFRRTHDFITYTREMDKLRVMVIKGSSD